jgi:hypothetical protein
MNQLRDVSNIAALSVVSLFFMNPILSSLSSKRDKRLDGKNDKLYTLSISLLSVLNTENGDFLIASIDKFLELELNGSVHSLNRHILEFEKKIGNHLKVDFLSCNNERDCVFAMDEVLPEILGEMNERLKTLLLKHS